MKRLACAAGVALTLVAAVVLVADPAGAQEKKGLTNKQIMARVAGKNGIKGNLDQAAKAGSPDWDAIQKQTREVCDLVDSLCKNAPSKGDKDSWEKLTKDYAGLSKTLDAATQKKDKEAYAAALAKWNAACKACHTAHRPPAVKK